jgi:putative acetyltransferase
MTIRPLKAADWRDCYEIWHAPRVLWATLGLLSQSRDGVREKVGNPHPDMHRFGAVVEDRVVSIATLSLARGRRSHTGYVGVSVNDSYQRRGIGKALMEALLNLADNWLNLRRLELEVMVDNEAALNLYRSSGFEVEGRRRQADFRAG